MTHRDDSALLPLSTRRALLALARASIAEQLGGGTAPACDEPILEEARGVFVTLSREGRLRGCIGRIEPEEVLATLLPSMARAAAFQDPRFPPVARGELDHLSVEISLLTTPRAAGVDDVVVGTHGVIVAERGRRALFLPQVAPEFGWSRDELLDEVCLKASLPADAWRRGGVTLHIFEAIVFGEADAA